MNNVYLISYYGGMFGDFICSKISEDENFYTQNVVQSDMNRYNYPNPFEKYGLNLHYWVLPLIDDHIAEKIDIEYSEKNLCFPTHWYGELSSINLPRIKGIRLLVDERLTLLTYLLSWIKAMRKISTFDIWTKEFDDIIKKYPSLIMLVDKIREKGSYHRFEKNCLQMGIGNYKEYVIQQWNIHQRVNLNKKLPNWTYLNMSELFFGDHYFLKEIQQNLSMSEVLKKTDIDEYHQKNLSLVEEEFGIDYHHLERSEWIEILCEYIDATTRSIIPT